MSAVRININLGTIEKKEDFVSRKYRGLKIIEGFSTYAVIADWTPHILKIEKLRSLVGRYGGTIISWE